LNTSPTLLTSGFDKVIPIEILVLLLILGMIIFVWDNLMRRSSSIQSAGGLDKNAEIVALRGSSLAPSKPLISESLGLSSQPHGIVKEGGQIIPVDVIPSSNKIKDRHVVQMLVHLRLIEELEGKRPPHGILIMGRDQRSVKIKNTEEKQRWLGTLIDEMRSIADGVPSVAKPQYHKCKNCDVRDLCDLSAYRGSPETKEHDDEEE